MAVDEKYVEEVKDGAMDKDAEMKEILAEMGIDAHYQPKSDNGIDLIEYDVYTPSDLIVGERYIGKPVLTDIISEEDKYTGEMKHRIELVLIDDSDMEAYICKVNLKESKYTWENPHPASGIYKLAIGLMEARMSGISQYYNGLDVVNIKALQKSVAKFETLTIKIVEGQFTTDDGVKKSYNTFVIVGGKLAE